MLANKKSQLTRRELDIMNILWDASKPLVASEFIKSNPALSISTVQTVLKKLVSKKFIEVDSIVYSGTVLTRSYRYLVSKKDYEKQALSASVLALKENNMTLSAFATAFFDLEKNNKKALAELEKLEEMIKEKRKDFQ